MNDDNQLRPHAETPDFPVERTEIPEWRQVPAEDDRTREVPGPPAAEEPTDGWASSGSGTTDHPGATTDADPAPPPPQPERIPAPTGPAWGTVAFGVVCLAVAAGALTLQFVDITVDWRYAAPLAFAGIGALLVLVGLIGLAGRRSQE